MTFSLATIKPIAHPANQDAYRMHMIKFIKMIFGGLIFTTALSATSLYIYQNRLIYPSWAGKAKEYVEKPTPETYPDLPFKEFFLETTDNVKLQCYDFQNPNSNITIVILRPNAGNIGHSLPRINYLFHTYNASIFIFSYRGYGYSEGSPTETGIKLDADCVMNHLANDRFHAEKKKLLLGTSIGGAVAIYIAHKFKSMVDGVILENTFLSLVKVIPYLLPYIKYAAPFCHERWNSESLISKVDPNTPFLFLNSEKDEIVPPDHSVQLFKLCNSSEKILKTFPFGYHNDILFQDGYWEIFHDFMYKYNFI